MNLKPLKGDLIDIHTHNTEIQKGVFSLLNVFPGDFPGLPSDKPITVGLHPWHVSPESQTSTRALLGKTATLPNVAGFGETGLDKAIKTDIGLQEIIFRIHAEISEYYKKPLIIHCVKAFQELISLKRELQPTIAWIIHGFRGSEELASELIKHGFWISVNESIIKIPGKAHAVLIKIPPERLFMETDEYPASVKKIYNFVEEYWNIDMKTQIFNNYSNIF